MCKHGASNSDQRVRPAISGRGHSLMPRGEQAVRGADGELGRVSDPSVQLSFGDLATVVFQSLLLARGALHVRHREWPTTEHLPEGAYPIICSSSGRGLDGDAASCVLEMEGALVRVFLSRDGVVRASFAAADPPRLDAAEMALLRLLPVESPPQPSNDGRLRVPLTFWVYGHMRQSSRRRLVVPTWPEITQNYPEATRERLAALFDGFVPGRDGQLILWHGLPGTGKTYAIRALAHAWSEWCDVQYVVDPEVFFGASTSHMLDVLTAADDYYELEPEARNAAPMDSGDERWRLLVLEDTGELLELDAKAQTGQALSRLLNLVDGLLGQGLRVLILITTNEPLAAVHPAVIRPGRCAANVEFQRLSVREANEWLRAHGSEARADGSGTLADLYGLVSGNEPAPSTARIGVA